MRGWIRIVVAVILIALLTLLAFGILRLVTGAVKNVDFGEGEPDPMFSQPPEFVTRPPEMDRETAQAEHPTLDDYIPEIESPVDKTAAELIAETKASAEN